MMNAEELLKFCCERSRTMRESLENGEMALADFIHLQADKVRKNRDIKPLLDPEDFYRRTEEFALERLGSDKAREVGAAVRLGAMMTADHHGGIYCAQTFQADLIYAEILKELGNETALVPVMSGGQVELDSSTYARGICLHLTGRQMERFPFFSSRPAARTAYAAPAVGEEMVKRFYGMVKESGLSENDKAGLSELVKEVYECDEVKGSSAFEDQVTRAGAVLSKKLFGEDGPVLAYLEAERLNAPILAKEISEKRTPLSRLFSDERAFGLMKNIKQSDGAPVTDILFKALDKKGRKINLSLNEDRMLRGRDWEGNDIAFPADPEKLTELILNQSLIPGFFLIACSCFFERGITWFGGVFQTEYLPEWQQMFADLLSGLEMKSEAETVRKYDCSGYVCGPMFALYGTDDFANVAGPVEFMIRKTGTGRLREMMENISLRDAHLIGISEMFTDLTRPDERPEGWYEKIGRELKELFPENIL